MDYEKAQILAMKLEKYASLEGSEVGHTVIINLNGGKYEPDT